MTKYLYAIVGNGDLVKVGISKNPDRRAMTLSTVATPLRAAYTALIPDEFSARQVEINAHSLLWAHRVRGEWFRVRFSEAKTAIQMAMQIAANGKRLHLPPKPDARSAIANFKTTPELKARIKAAAKAERRTVSQFLSNLIEDHYERKDAQP